MVLAAAEMVLAAELLGIELALLARVGVVSAVVEHAEPSEPAASSLFSFQYYVPAAEDVALVLLHHCTLRKTWPNDTAILLNVWPFEVASSANLEAHWACVASRDGH
jgi:hypothetical protein